jgi:HAE1 family hydrophobic/amphiphilic exporter-1
MLKKVKKIPPKAETKKPLSYLQRLQFDPAMLKGFVAGYVQNIRIVILLALAISILGIVSFFSLPKRLNPEVKIPIITVATVLPGAGPADVESLVTIPLEDELRGLKGIDKMTSSSRDNVSVVTMQFFSSVKQDDAKKDVQSAVDSVNDLPEDAKKPTVTALDFEDQPIWTFSVTTDGDLPSLMSFSQELKRKLVDLPKVDRVLTSGFEEQEVVVRIQPEKLQEFGLNPLSFSQAIKKAVSAYPAGTLSTNANTFSLTIDPSVVTIADLREIQIPVQGKVLTLGQMATIEERSKMNQEHSYLADSKQEPKRVVTFNVYKTSTVNIDDAGKDVHKVAEEVFQKYGNAFHYTTITDTSKEIDDQFVDLLGEFRSTIILVFVCLFLFLGLRQAVISSFTIPLTFLSAFFFAKMFGMSINFLTLFALLLALGLLVDDTIVTVSAMTTYFKTGKFTPLQTGLLVWRDTIVPIWSTTITTIWSFVPLLLTSGIIGEFIKPIPIVVTVTMLSSTAIAVLITLPIMIVILKPNFPGRVKVFFKGLLLLISLAVLFFILAGNPLLPLIAVLYMGLLVVFSLTSRAFGKAFVKLPQKYPVLERMRASAGRFTNHGLIDVEGFAQAYKRLMTKILAKKSARRKVIFAIVAYSIFAFALLPLGFVKNEFFPSADQEVISATLELPAGTTLATTEKETVHLLNDLRHTPEADFVIAQVGQSGSQGNSGSNLVFFSIHLPPKEERKRSSIDITEELRKQFASYRTGKLTFQQESGGPPAGADLQISILGDDLAKLDEYANQVMAYLNTQKGVINVEKSIKPGVSKIVFVPDYAKLTEAGVSVDSVGLWTRIYASGFTLQSINFDKRTSDKEDVVFKFNNEIPNASGLTALSIPSMTGSSLPLMSLGSFQLKTNPTVISRENGKRVVTITAGVQKGYVIPQLNKGLEGFAKTLKLDAGYNWQTGGVNEENAKSIQSILQAMIVSALLILITMVIQFRSFRQALIVLIVIPLAVSSVFLVFALTGIPLSFPALIGVLSLFGIVVTNSMFIVDKINLNQREGMPFREAIADAGASRLEPIILTKLCTVLGLLPITITNPLWRGLGGAIISGLLLASTIMLLFIPSVYYELFKASHPEDATAK